MSASLKAQTKIAMPPSSAQNGTGQKPLLLVIMDMAIICLRYSINNVNSHPTQCPALHCCCLDANQQSIWAGTAPCCSVSRKSRHLGRPILNEEYHSQSSQQQARHTPTRWMPFCSITSICHKKRTMEYHAPHATKNKPKCKYESRGSSWKKKKMSMQTHIINQQKWGN